MKKYRMFTMKGSMRSIIKTALARYGYAVVRSDLPGYFFADWVTRLGTDLVFDVGANIGDYALQLRSRGYAGRIVSFEPLTEVFEELSKRAKSEGKWTALNLALGQEVGEFEINIGDYTVTSSFRCVTDSHAETHAWARSSCKQTAKMTRLDDIFDHHARPDDRVVLKMDVQGFEDQVLRGGLKSLPRISGIQTEMAIVPTYSGQTDMLSQIRWLEGVGFKLVDLVNGTRADDGYLIEVDGFFVRA
jgi:FkbM family methyltransferase